MPTSRIPGNLQTHRMYSSQISLKLSLSGSHRRSSYSLFRRTEAVSWVFSVRGRQLGMSWIWPATFRIFLRPGDAYKDIGHGMTSNWNAEAPSSPGPPPSSTSCRFQVYYCSPVPSQEVGQTLWTAIFTQMYAIQLIYNK